MNEHIRNRFDFVLLFDVKDGNPNGDPDAGNLPRLDAESGQGLVTDVCIKRKVRNYVSLLKGDTAGYEIYVKERSILNDQHEKAYAALGLQSEKKKLPKDETKARQLVQWMCATFFDIRTFGAVMTTEVNAGQVRGPVQFTFARSVSRVFSAEHAVTRMAVTKKADLEKERTIGRKFTVPYGLYRMHGFVSAPLAQQTGFGEADIALLWDALLNMFEHERSAARGEMATQKLILFKHDGPLGSAPSQDLFARVTVEQRADVGVPRSFADYCVEVRKDALPAGVEVLELR